MPGREQRGDAERKKAASAVCMSHQAAMAVCWPSTVGILRHPSILGNLISALATFPSASVPRGRPTFTGEEGTSEVSSDPSRTAC